MTVNTRVPSVFPSVMRTVVPLVAGVAITALARLGLDFSSEATTSVVTAAVAAAYYMLFRLLERVTPEGGRLEKLFGLMLGFARPPIYPVAAPAQPATAPRPVE